MKAYLILEDGSRFEGKIFGAVKDTIGEVVFNTGMTGYQEVLTDPSYAGQIVVMTYPLIGNYGINNEDFESYKPHVKGFIVREACTDPSNWRAEKTLHQYLKENDIVGFEGIDTRALTKILREKGTMVGIITTDQSISQDRVDELFKKFSMRDVVLEVTTKEPYRIEGVGPKIAVLDYGIKQNILRMLKQRGCDITVFSATSGFQDIASINPDGILLSNGPGDPKALVECIEVIKRLIDLKKPIFGICLGHQLLSLAFGGDTYKLKYGHRGCNHPVKDYRLDRVFITSQNHGYAVNQNSIRDKGLEITHINVNDGTVEGMRHKDLPVMSVQYHPEASPGPMDSSYLFDEFMELIERQRR